MCHKKRRAICQNSEKPTFSKAVYSHTQTLTHIHTLFLFSLFFLFFLSFFFSFSRNQEDKMIKNINYLFTSPYHFDLPIPCFLDIQDWSFFKTKSISFFFIFLKKTISLCKTLFLFLYFHIFSYSKFNKRRIRFNASPKQ